MVIVRSSTEISHYLKIVGVDDSIPVVSGKVREAFEDLQQQTIPDDIQRRLTFAMKLSDDHHCTICFIDQRFTDEMIQFIENYLINWNNQQFNIVATGVSKFGKKPVILLEFTSEYYNNLFQFTSQQGTPEGGKVRKPHLTCYGNEEDENKVFILNILRQLYPNLQNISRTLRQYFNNILRTSQQSVPNNKSTGHPRRR